MLRIHAGIKRDLREDRCPKRGTWRALHGRRRLRGPPDRGCAGVAAGALGSDYGECRTGANRRLGRHYCPVVGRVRTTRSGRFPARRKPAGVDTLDIIDSAERRYSLPALDRPRLPEHMSEAADCAGNQLRHARELLERLAAGQTQDDGGRAAKPGSG